jgi:hypothetical protein
MAAALPQRGVLRVVPDATLDAQLKQQDAERAAAAVPKSQDVSMTNLASYIRTQYEIMSNHRNDGAAGWGDRLLSAQRVFNGQYSPDQLAAIKAFGGSEIYARLIAMKARGASALLRDVYLGADRPWGLKPPGDPDVPAEIIGSINQLVQGELAGIANSGMPSQAMDPATIRDRVQQLMAAARETAKKRAAIQAEIAEDKIDEILTQGNFYKAIAEFLVDVPLFPFACIKGPEVKIVPSVVWEGGKPSVRQQPRMFWARKSPFDIFFTPGVSAIEDAAVIERSRLTRADLNDLLDLPGYDQEALRKVLEEYGAGGIHDNWDTTDSQRAAAENRENPMTNRSGMMACLEFHGNVQGTVLLSQGMDPGIITDPIRDYFVQAWLIGRHVIKVQMSPSPRKRHPYYITSFEKVPGTPVGNGLPDILADIGDVANATLRALVNNMSIASGPQVVINDDRIAPGADSENLYPWKRWHVSSDPLSNNTQAPISFFQPVSNAQELLTIYKQFSEIADDLSAIPKYLSGGTSGGAGRTAAGLAMLMGNASKILQTVAANIDRDVMDPALTNLFDMLMLTDTSGMLTGQEQVSVQGVNVAIQRETQRARQLEFLTATANPIDAQIMGVKGRSVVLRSVAQTIGIPGEEIVPSAEDQARMEQQNQAQAQQEAAAAAQGDQKKSSVTKDVGPRVRIAGGAG